MIYIRKAILLVILSISFYLISCSGGKRNLVNDTAVASFDNNEIMVEAYLFDVKIRRKGKPTTIRLDLYQSDSAIAMYGRGYFNKGAFTGRLTKDSMLIYFPTTKEYLHESIESLFQSFDCETELTSINLLSYFINFPDSADITQNLNIETISEDNNNRLLKVLSANCPWRLSLGYAIEEKGWRIKNFEFDDGAGVSLKGNQRRYKFNASVPASRFHISIPDGSKKITL